MLSFSLSVLPVHQNAIKNILFRLSAILLQFCIYKLFSFLAFKSSAYTSFLMFAEDIVQKLLFVSSRGFTSRHALLVVAFTALFTAGGLYDTLLWALDNPGFVIRSTIVPASSVASQLLSNPSYIIFANTVPPSTSDLDELMSANLFKPGFNFSFPSLISPPGTHTRTTVPPALPLSKAGGPRIWLDTSGFSVGVDQAVAITGSSQFDCTPRVLSTTQQMWKCPLNNSLALNLANHPAGLPQIWWEGTTGSLDEYMASDYLSPNRRDNPWQSLGIGGDTVLMKQVFTVTKSQRRHTFLETVFKISMLSQAPSTTLDPGEITDLIRRAWALNASQEITPDIQVFASQIISAQTNGTSLTFGAFLQSSDYTVLSSVFELLSPLNPSLLTTNTSEPPPPPLYTILRITSTNITLLFSETLSSPITSFSPSCNLSSTNLATGGQVRSSTCYKSSLASSAQNNGSFHGQLDTSSTLILSDVLGTGSSDRSAIALNQTSVDWFRLQESRIDAQLVARGLVQGGDRETVGVEVKRTEAALSYLQLVLVLLPVVLAGWAWVVMKVGANKGGGCFGNSFLAAVVSTATHHPASSHRDGGEKEGSGGLRREVGYLHDPPEIRILTTEGQTVLLEMGGDGFLGVTNRTYNGHGHIARELRGAAPGSVERLFTVGDKDSHGGGIMKSPSRNSTFGSIGKAV
jgi:hypothetical protein